MADHQDAHTIRVQILTPVKTLVNTEAKGVVLPQVDGEVYLQSNHSRLVSVLDAGTVRIIDAQDEIDTDAWDIAGGMAYFKDNMCTIMTPSIASPPAETQEGA